MKNRKREVYNRPLDTETRMMILANALIDRVLEMTPEERRRIEAEIKKSKKSQLD